MAVNLSAVQFRRSGIGAEVLAALAALAATGLDPAGLELELTEFIAEGVEAPLLASQIRFMGCDEAQGYLYAPPLAVQDLDGWFARTRGYVWVEGNAQRLAARWARGGKSGWWTRNQTRATWVGLHTKKVQSPPRTGRTGAKKGCRHGASPSGCRSPRTDSRATR